MILVIDNYDSFVYNLARYFACAGMETTVRRNDQITVEEAAAMAPECIVLSPGPCTPKEAGISIDLIKTLGTAVPIFGVCLGHQCIGEAYGGETVRTAPVHGKPSVIRHDGTGIFAGLPKNFSAGRYHSLVSKIHPDLPLAINARSKTGEIMGLRHKTHPVYGVQFHPESVLTQGGQKIIRNFLAIAAAFRQRQKQKAAA